MAGTARSRPGRTPRCTARARRARSGCGPSCPARRASGRWPASRPPSGGTPPAACARAAGRVVARHEEQRLEELVRRCRSPPGRCPPGCPRRSRRPTARCRRVPGSSCGSRVSAVSTLSVLAGRRCPCGSLAASTSPVVEVGEQVRRGVDLAAAAATPARRRRRRCSPGPGHRPDAGGRVGRGRAAPWRRAGRAGREHEGCPAAAGVPPARCHRGQANGAGAAAG